MSRKPFVRKSFLETKNDIRNRKLDDTNKKIGYLYVEDITDKEFWQKIATEHTVMVYQNNAKFFMVGKGNLLYYKNDGESESLLDKCSHRLLIAIDSDFDEVCPNSIESNWIFHHNKKFILQTYAHGRENIVFSPDCLYQILEHKFKLYIDNHNNPILDIFEKLSALWFEPYQKFLFLYNQKNASFTHDDWIKEISFQNQEKKDIALNQDFSAYQARMSALNQKLNQYLDNQDEFISFCKHLREKGFSKEYVWAFIRCHDFESQFVQVLLGVLKHHRLHQEKLYIQQNFSGQEIGNQNRKLANYFNDKMDSQTVLENYFYDTYCQNYKHQDLFLQKIVADYQRVIQEK